MHSAIIITLIGTILLLGAVGVEVPFSLLAASLALGVLLIGLPHGGLDQKIGLKLLRRFDRPVALAIFFAAYLLVAAVVVAGWFLSPQLTILAFFTMSAWHFGLEEETRENLTFGNRFGVIARGGLVIWIPACFQGEAVTNLLALILPSGNRSIAGEVVTTIQLFAPVLFALLVYDTFISGKTSRQTSFEGRQRYLHQIRVLAFAALFATVDPLVSFGVYFCTWHSVIGLIHLREQFRLSNGELAVKLLPISLLAIGLFLVGFVVSSSVNLFAPAVVQTIFIGLSAVAVPHLLLHVVSDSLNLSAQGAGS